MGLFSGGSRVSEVRAMTWPWDVLPGQAATVTNFAGVDANGENALRSIAVGASIDLICSVGSELPLDVFRGQGRDRQQVSTPSWLDDPGGDGQGLSDWVYQLLQSWLYRGNAFGDVLEFDARMRPRQVQWFHPDSVRVIVGSDGALTWTVNGRPVLDTTRFVHHRTNPMAGRLLGMSVVEWHATQIGTSLSSAAFGRQWFADGAHPSALLTNTEATLDQQQSKTVKDRWMALFNGRREPAVLGKGWDYRPIQVTPEESQFLETQRFSEAQCARMFGPAMPETLGYETGGSMTYANVVDRRSDLLTLTLNRWLRRAERVITGMLPVPQYARFNRDAFLESTTLARFEAHSRALADRWRTVNEVRELEDLPPVAWGDVPNEKTTTPPAGGA